jgi:hypothetical protein
LNQILVRCRTGAQIDAPGYGPSDADYSAENSATKLSNGWMGSGFEWYDTFQVSGLF